MTLASLLPDTLQLDLRIRQMIEHRVKRNTSDFLASLPKGYRHLAYLGARVGHQVKLKLPLLKSEVMQEPNARGALVLAGGPLAH